MEIARGFYINIYDEYEKDVFVLFNEVNDEPTIEECDVIHHIIEKEIKTVCTAERLQEVIEDISLNCTTFGVQVFISHAESDILLR